MRKTNDERHKIQLSDVELNSMTADLRDAHSDTLPAMRASLSAWDVSEDDNASGMSRRSFLTRTGLLAAGGLLVASSGAAASANPRTQVGQTALSALRRDSRAPLDLRVAALEASLENLAVATYGAALSAATAGKLGTVPNAVATFVETAMAQHKDHAAAWNAIIFRAGYKKVTAPNAAIAKSVDSALAKLSDVPGVARLALSLEEAAAATYLEAIGVMSGRAAIETAATIQPVEMQHAAILNVVLGRDPVPAAFAVLDGAVALSDAKHLAISRA